MCFRQQFEGTEFSGRCPVSHVWDESEPRLFVCETVPISSEASSSSFLDMVNTFFFPLSAVYWECPIRLNVNIFLTLRCPHSAQTEVSVVTLFCTQEHGLLLQDCFPKPSGLQALLALDVPYYYFSCKVRTENRLFYMSLLIGGGGVGWVGMGFSFGSMFFFCYFPHTHHCSHVFWSKIPPAIISEGGFLSTGSKCLSPAQKASVFLIPSFNNCNCVCLVLQKSAATQVHPLKTQIWLYCAQFPIHLTFMYKQPFLHTDAAIASGTDA